MTEPGRHRATPLPPPDRDTIAVRVLSAACCALVLGSFVGIAQAAAPKVTAAAADAPPVSATRTPVSASAGPLEIPTIGAEGAWDPDAANRPESPSAVRGVPVHRSGTAVAPAATQTASQATPAFAGASVTATSTPTATQATTGTPSTVRTTSSAAPTTTAAASPTEPTTPVTTDPTIDPTEPTTSPPTPDVTEPTDAVNEEPTVPTDEEMP